MAKFPRHGSVFGGNTIVRQCLGCSSLLLCPCSSHPKCVVCSVFERVPLAARRVIHEYHLGDNRARKERYRLLSDLVHSDYLGGYRSVMSWRRWRRRHGFTSVSLPRMPIRLAPCKQATRQHVEGCSVGELERCRSLFRQTHKTYLALLRNSIIV